MIHKVEKQNVVVFLSMPVKILIQTGKAVSLNEVARQIGYVAEQRGLVPVLNRYMPSFVSYRKLFNGAVFIYPLLPVWCNVWFYHYTVAKKELDGNVLFYTTVEGVPKKFLILDYVFRDCEFIAVSRYVKERLEKVGLRVIDVVHHGYPEYELTEIDQLAENYRRLIKANFGDKVIFGYVGDYNIRKGVDKLLTAVKELASKRRDFQVLLVTKKDVLSMIKDVPNVSFTSEFGVRSHVEIMAFYKAVDFLVFPTQAEGFGLPVLEANAVGRPAIIVDLPPYKEFTDLNLNLVVNHKNIRLVDTGDGVLYEIHEYDPKDLASEMERAIEMYRNYKSEYEDRCEKLKEKVKDLKSEVQYSKLLDKLRFTSEK